MVIEMDAFFRNSSEFCQRENLESTTVGQDWAVPAHESMKSAKVFDHLQTRPQEEMIGVAENNLRAHRAKLLRGHRLDGALGANGHEDRRFDDPMFGEQSAPASPRRGINLEYFERHRGLVTQTTSGAGSTREEIRKHRRRPQRRGGFGELTKWHLFLPQPFGVSSATFCHLRGLCAMPLFPRFNLPSWPVGSKLLA